MASLHHGVLEVLRGEALRLGDGPRDYDALLESAATRSLVLLGEATHGTEEFYRMRADITLRLIAEQGFDAVAVEADWPDAYRINLFVRGEGRDADASPAFGDFRRFPRWMWRNEGVLRFAEALHQFNLDRPSERRAGFYGMDMYSLYRSAEAVVDYLSGVDEEQAAIARRQYAALDHVRDPQRYGYEAVHGLRPDCRQAVRERLLALWQRAPDYLGRDGRGAADAFFFAERNAQVVASGEAYYRAMFGPRAQSWNLRDRHMVDTLLALQAHLRAQGGAGRIVVWAHNSHLGDARATEMSYAGEWNVGQLVRQRAGEEAALLVGFTTYVWLMKVSTPARSPPLTNGMVKPSAAMSCRPGRTATNRCSTRPGWIASTCRCRARSRMRWARRCASAPSGCCTVRTPSCRAITSWHRCRRSSTRCSTWTRPARCSRWTWPPRPARPEGTGFFLRHAVRYAPCSSGMSQAYPSADSPSFRKSPTSGEPSR